MAPPYLDVSSISADFYGCGLAVAGQLSLYFFKLVFARPAHWAGPIIWNFFKWFGMHEVSIYAPDENFLNWALQYFINSNYDSRHNSINGGIGVFGSASVVRDTSFIIKNQP